MFPDTKHYEAYQSDPDESNSDEDDSDKKKVSADHGIFYRKCAPHSVDMETMQLRVRGMKIDNVQKLFPWSSKLHAMTLEEFWLSTFGEHIQPHLSGEGPEMHLEILQAFVYPWSIKAYSYEDAVTVFAHLHEISRHPESADRVMGVGADHIRDLLETLQETNPAAHDAISEILTGLWRHMCILTDKGCFGRVPECNIRAGDEVYLLLGCLLAAVLRKQPDGT